MFYVKYLNVNVMIHSFNTGTFCTFSDVKDALQDRMFLFLNAKASE